MKKRLAFPFHKTTWIAIICYRSVSTTRATVTSSRISTTSRKRQSTACSQTKPFLRLDFGSGHVGHSHPASRGQGE